MKRVLPFLLVVSLVLNGVLLWLVGREAGGRRGELVRVTAGGSGGPRVEARPAARRGAAGGGEAEVRPQRVGGLEFLSAEKAAAVEAIERDYREIEALLRRQVTGVALPVDQERLRALERERRVDLAAALSAEELAAYEARFSASALTWQAGLAAAGVSTAERVALVEAMRRFEEDWSGPVPEGMAAVDWQAARSGAAARVAEEVRGLLGEERGAAALWGREVDYTLLSAAVERYGLAADTPQRVMRLRDEVGSMGERLLARSDIPVDAQRAALRELAAEARRQVTAWLGAEAMEAIGAGPLRWIESLERGSVTIYEPVTRTSRTVGVGVPPGRD